MSTPSRPGRRPPSDRGVPAESRAHIPPWRALILLGVLVLAAVIVVPPLTGWLEQRSEIAQLESRIQADQEATRELAKQREQLGQDDYVAELARTRLDYALPGEKRYHVFDPEGQDGAVDGATGVAAGEVGEGAAWYDQLWTSVQDSAQAGAPGAGGAGTSRQGGQPGEDPTGSPFAEEPQDVQDIPKDVPSVITDEDFDPQDIPKSDLSADPSDPGPEEGR